MIWRSVGDELAGEWFLERVVEVEAHDRVPRYAFDLVLAVFRVVGGRDREGSLEELARLGAASVRARGGISPD